jgi:hypothetical protein
MLLCFYVFMRTTIDLPDDLFTKVKVTASVKGMSMKTFITKAVEHEIEAQTVHLDSRKVELPLVPSKHPGSLSITSEEIAKLLEHEDLHGLTGH